MFCYESSLNGFYEPRRAAPDGVNINDAKTLKNLIQVSTFYQPDPHYLETCQENEFTIEMRRQLTDWMFGISDICEDGVLPHAVNLLDRYLSLSKVQSPREELQVLGATCLFLASKLRETTPLSVDTLCDCGGYSYTMQHVRQWELKILNVLNWDTSAVLPHDLLDHFLHRLPIPEELKPRVTNHARTLINMCCTEYVFLPHSSKMMATGCLYDAIFALGSKYLDLRRRFSDLMAEFIHIDKEEFANVYSKIRNLMNNNRNDLPPVESPITTSFSDDSKSLTPHSTPTNIEELCCS